MDAKSQIKKKIHEEIHRLKVKRQNLQKQSITHLEKIDDLEVTLRKENKNG